MSGFYKLLKKSTVSLLNLRRIAEEQSNLKVLFVTFFITFLIAGLWTLFYNGFRFLDYLGGGLMIIQRLFAIFFFGLGGLLVLSSAIAAYTTIYRSFEMPFLQLLPVKYADILYYKLLETSLLSFWAFFIIIIPFVGAYAVHQDLSIFFTIWTFVFSIPFVMLNAAVGCIATVLIVRFFPRGRAGWLTGLLVLTAVVTAIMLRPQTVFGTDGSSDLLLSQLVPGINFASNPLWPSYWVAEGILSLSRGYWMRGSLFLGLLCSQVLVMALIFETIGLRFFYDGWQRTMMSRQRALSQTTSWDGVNRLLKPLASDLRALVMKDLRIFFRDPAQWSQALIFFGLLAVYFVNLRNLNYHELQVEWRNLITFLNIFGVSAVMCSFGTRFIYPQPSLEGQGFWIVGMSPTTMGRVMLAKFISAWSGLGLVSIVLMFLSVTMLDLPSTLKLVAMGIAFFLSMGVSGLSVGLGSVFLDLRQKNPAAIISGFGGTLNLILSLVMMLAVIVPFGVIFHYEFDGRFPTATIHRWRNLGAAWMILICFFACLAPMLLGLRTLRRREY